MVLILLGFGIKRTRFLPEETWPGMERLTYYILFPALLISAIANQRIEGSPWGAMLLVVVGTLMAASIVLVSWFRFRSNLSGPTFTSIFQGGVRFNSYIALAVAQAFYGFKGLAMAALAAGFMIVLINVLCISAFVVWGHAARRGIRPLMREVIVNPLIIGCVIGWILSLSHIGLPGVTKDIFEIIGRAALPFGLLAVGAALKPEAISGHIGSIAISSVIQFVMKPVVAVLLITATGLTGVAAAVLIIAFITPTASSSYILARQLGGDAETMASIITFQTLLAFAFMPFIAWLLLS